MRDLVDPYQFGPRPHRLRPAPLRGGHALSRLGAAGRRGAGRSGPSTACTSPCGRRTRSASASSATSTAGTGACTSMRRLVPVRGLGNLRPRPARRRPLQVRGADARRAPAATRPIPTPARSRRRPTRRRSCRPAAATRGATPTGWRPRASLGEWRERPMSIYEVHLGSWRRREGEPQYSLSYRELAATLVPYVRDMGYTHIELLPVMEHPFFGSWGYQVVGFFAPIEPLRHARRLPLLRRRSATSTGSGVILDWVPGHFPEGRARSGALRRHGAVRARGSAPRRAPRVGHAGLQLRPRRGADVPAEQRALLAARSSTSTGCAWTRWRRCCISTTRGREGEWLPNQHGGRENLEAVEFLKQLNVVTHGRQPGHDHDRRGVHVVAGA